MICNLDFRVTCTPRIEANFRLQSLFVFYMLLRYNAVSYTMFSLNILTAIFPSFRELNHSLLPRNPIFFGVSLRTKR